MRCFFHSTYRCGDGEWQLCKQFNVLLVATSVKSLAVDCFVFERHVDRNAQFADERVELLWWWFLDSRLAGLWLVDRAWRGRRCGLNIHCRLALRSRRGRRLLRGLRLFGGGAGLVLLQY